MNETKKQKKNVLVLVLLIVDFYYDSLSESVSHCLRHSRTVFHTFRHCLVSLFSSAFQNFSFLNIYKLYFVRTNSVAFSKSNFPTSKKPTERYMLYIYTHIKSAQQFVTRLPCCVCSTLYGLLPN